jgi:hypothetical protein
MYPTLYPFAYLTMYPLCGYSVATGQEATHRVASLITMPILPSSHLFFKFLQEHRVSMLRIYSV